LAEAEKDVQSHEISPDAEVAIERITTAAAMDSFPDSIILEVKPGPTFLLNGIEVPREELSAFIAEIYAPRSRKVLFARNDAERSDAVFEAAIEAARDGLEEAIASIEPRYRPGSGEYVGIKVIDPAAR